MESKKFRFSPMKALVYLATAFTFAIVLFLVGYIIVNGIPQIVNEIIKLTQGLPSIFNLEYNSDNVSIVPSVINTLSMIVFTILISAFLGISTAIYLVEYAKSDNKLVIIIRITAETLAGIPSIIYGLFGMIFFATYLGFGYSILSGILTASIMILPLIIRSTEEALKSVPQSFREASFGLGANKLRTIFVIILPSAMNGILAGIILGIGRIVGETAALIFTFGTATELASTPFISGRTLSVHMYMLTGEGIHVNQAYATAAILLVVVLLINTISTILAKRLMKG